MITKMDIFWKFINYHYVLLEMTQKSAIVSITIEDGESVKDTWSRKTGLNLRVFGEMDSFWAEEFTTSMAP